MSNNNRTFAEQRIYSAFENALRRQKAALMPYYTLGYPDRETSLEVVEAIAPYSDLLELGVPFSDPLADGPSIQASTQQALKVGVTTVGCLEMVEQLRQRGVKTPILLMGYYNPILAYGEAAFVRDAAEVGADGFIVPDLPFEEAQALEQLVLKQGLVLVSMLAPTSHEERIRRIAKPARGFLYLVSLAGVTGARQSLAEGLADFVAAVREQSSVPLAVGFGIGTPQQAATVAQSADGVIVGSALINAVAAARGSEAAAAVAFVKSLRDALRN